MHGSIWLFRGDAEALAARFDDMLAAIGSASITAMVVLKADDGLLLIDTCPSQEAYAGFYFGADFDELLAAHGLPRPEHVADAPVHAVISAGKVLAAA